MNPAHDPDCDVNEENPEGIQKPCNCGYDKFLASMVQFCHCEPAGVRPCPGVCAGGPCDGAKEQERQDPEERCDCWEDEW